MSEPVDEGGALPSGGGRGRSGERGAGGALARALDVLPFLMTPVVLAALVVHYWPHVSDDGYIFFRYARHVVDGLGPVWNPGERVEGFSSPLWLGVLSLGMALGLHPHDVARLAGNASVVGVVLLTGALARRLGASWRGAGFAALLAAAGQGLLFWAPSGLETAAYALLWVWAAFALVGPSPGAWAVPVGLIGVMRPEGPGVVLAFTFAAVLLKGRPALARWTGLLAAGPAAAWIGFRLVYYGWLLPNTYYAKATGEQPMQLLTGLFYAAGTWTSWLLLLIVTILWRGEDRVRLAVLLVVTGALLAVISIGGGDWMWHGRLLVPIIPILLAASFGFMRDAPPLPAEAGPGARPTPRWLVLAVTGGSVFALLWFSVPPYTLSSALAGERLAPRHHQEGTMIPALERLADWLKARYPADTLLAVNHAGALPYFTDFPTLDMTGLNDVHIAHASHGGVHEKFDAAYVMERRPDVVVLNAWVRPGTGGAWYVHGYWEGESALVMHPDFRKTYRAIPRYWTWRLGTIYGYIMPFERVDVGLPPAPPSPGPARPAAP